VFIFSSYATKIEKYFFVDLETSNPQIHSLYISEKGVAFLENRLFSSQSKQFWKLSKSSDWLEKRQPSKKASYFWKCKPYKTVFVTSAALSPVERQSCAWWILFRFKRVQYLHYRRIFCSYIFKFQPLFLFFSSAKASNVNFSFF